MRIKMLVATVDILYAKLISDNISECHADKVDVSICSALEGLQDALTKHKYNVALIDATLIEHVDTSAVNLLLLLWSETETTAGLTEKFEKIDKYQRISSIVSTVLEKYAKLSNENHNSHSRHAKVTAVWSPVGGIGKTSVALAYALSCADNGKEVFYLNLEYFTSTPGYFKENGKSISSVFEMLENHEGDVKMLIQGISCRDNGITYLCGPDNFDDLCVLSCEHIYELIKACASLADELVIDLSSVCDARTRKVFEHADSILLVTGQTGASETKMTQFMTQNNVFDSIKDKVTLVANKGATVSRPLAEPMISFPQVESNDMRTVCKILSEVYGQWSLLGNKGLEYDRAM